MKTRLIGLFFAGITAAAWAGDTVIDRTASPLLMSSDDQGASEFVHPPVQGYSGDAFGAEGFGLPQGHPPIGDGMDTYHDPFAPAAMPLPKIYRI